MKKFSLLLTTGCLLVMASCKKSDNQTTPTDNGTTLPPGSVIDVRGTIRTDATAS